MVLLGDLPAKRDWQLVLPDELAEINRRQAIELPRSHLPGRPPRLKLPENTPAGTYAARLVSGDQSEGITIEVTAAPRLVTMPGSLRFVVRVGTVAEARIAFANRGNTILVIPAHAHVGLYDDDGIELAFADTYRQPQNVPETLFGNWLQKLREGHGGLSRLQVTEGAARLAPGETRMLTLTIAPSDRLKPGHSYHGVWNLAPLKLAVAVAVERNGNGNGAIQ